MLKRVPGLGPKGASRILVELSGFIVDNHDGSDESSFLLHLKQDLLWSL